MLLWLLFNLQERLHGLWWQPLVEAPSCRDSLAEHMVLVCQNSSSSWPCQPTHRMLPMRLSHWGRLTVGEQGGFPDGRWWIPAFGDERCVLGSTGRQNTCSSAERARAAVAASTKLSAVWRRQPNYRPYGNPKSRLRRDPTPSLPPWSKHTSSSATSVLVTIASSNFSSPRHVPNQTKAGIAGQHPLDS